MIPVKKRLTLLFTLALLFFAAPAAYAADFTLWINGSNPAGGEDMPYIKQGRVMVPLRLISESFGFDVTWNGAERKVTMAPANDRVKNMPTFSVKIGSRAIYANGNQLSTTDVAAEIRNDYTYVPLRAIAELFGYPVRWDDGDRAAIIGNEEPVPYVNRFGAKDMALFLDGQSKGKINAFAEKGQLYVRADAFAKAMAMSYKQEGMTFSDDPLDLTINMKAKDGFGITYDCRYVTSTDGLNFGMYAMDNYIIRGNKAYIAINCFVDAKHMKLNVEGDSIRLTTDPTPETYPITILKYEDEGRRVRYLPSKSGMTVVWSGKNYRLKNSAGKEENLGKYMERIFGDDSLHQSPPSDKTFHRALGMNNHFYLMRQGKMVIGGISD